MFSFFLFQQRRSTLVPASMMNADLDSKKQSKELSLILTEPHALGYSRHTSFGSSAPHAEEFRMSSQKFSGITLLGKKQGPPTRDLIPEPPLVRLFEWSEARCTLTLIGRQKRPKRSFSVIKFLPVRHFLFSRFNFALNHKSIFNSFLVCRS